MSDAQKLDHSAFDPAGSDIARIGYNHGVSHGNSVFIPDTLTPELSRYDVGPNGELVPAALRALARGGVVVCAGIHMSDIPSFPYELLWEERVVRSVANLTRRDGEEFLALAPGVPVRTEVEAFPLEQANEALEALRSGRIRGAAVLRVD